MTYHVPPPGAAKAIERAAEIYMADVQKALGTAHKPSVTTIALMGVIKNARRFGVNEVDIWLAVAKLLRR